jgi:hypothetical protein
MKIRLLPTALIFFCVAMFLGVSSARAQSVSVFASPSTITNAGDDAQLTFVLSFPSSRDILVKLMVSGSAGPGDYVLFGENLTSHGQVWIPAGHTAASIYLHAFADGDPAGTTEVAKITILRGHHYQVGSPSSASVTIDNVDTK